MTQRCVTLYSAESRLTDAHQPVTVVPGVVVWVRAQVGQPVDTEDPTEVLSEALDEAQPMAGEVILNVVAVEFNQ